MGYTIDGLLSRLTGDQRTPERDPAGPHKETLDQVRARTRQTFTSLAEKAAAIRANPTLSPEGKRQQLAQLKQQDLGFLDRPRTATADQIQQLRGRLFAIPRSEYEPGEARDREREIREAYKGKSLHERQAAFAAAMKNGKHEVLRAFIHGPLGSLVDAEFQQLVHTEQAQRTQPEVFANYEQAQNLQEHLNSLHSHAVAVLNELDAA